jgi:hypothetical protein
MRNNSLTNALVAGPGRLGATPRGGVGMPQPLPPATRFGSLNPSITTGNRFSGGVVPGAQNMVHPEMPQTFQAPKYSAPSMSAPTHPLAPIVAALVSTGVGAPTSTGGGYSPPPPPQTHQLVAPSQQAPTGRWGTPAVQSLLDQPPTYANLSSLVAELAQRGQKVNPGGGSFVKSY